jgi:putative transposase
MKTKSYPSDLTDAQWALVEPLIPPAWPGGRPRKHAMREIIDALFYITREGCSWRALPHDFPPWKTVYNYMIWFEIEGAWDRIQTALIPQVRAQAERNETPTVGCVDSQTVPSSSGGEQIGNDGGKLKHGRKRHILTDSMGLLLAMLVTAANVDDGTAASELVDRRDRIFTETLEMILGDRKYKNNQFKEYLHGQNLRLEISSKPEGETGFKPLKIRWVVEQTFGCFGRWRRLNRDYEKTVRSSEIMVKLASIHRMARRLEPRQPANRFNYRKTTSNQC